MNLLSKQFVDALRSIKLSGAERAHMKDTLMSHMVLTPLSIKSVVPAQVQSPLFTRHTFRKTLPITLITLLLMGAGVSYAAEGTLPGDKLYPVKIHVNEGVRRAFAMSETAKAETEVDFASRRLNEAVELEKSNRLSTTTKEELKQSFKEHRVRAAERIKNVERKNKDDARRISRELRTSFGNHRDGLKLLDEESNEQHDEDVEQIKSSDTEQGSVVGTTTPSALQVSTVPTDTDIEQTQKESEKSQGWGERGGRGRHKEND